MKSTKVYWIAAAVVVAVCMLSTFGCRSIPCTSVEALQSSYAVFLEDHIDYLESDESLSEEDKAVILRHAMLHKDLIDELGKLCEEE